VALPSDSTVAVAMKSHQAAEREEQQRIKSLVLNYDLRDGEEQDGDTQHEPLHLNPNIHNSPAGIDKAAAANARPDKSSNNRSGQRARKLQLSDVDGQWYGSKKSPSVTVQESTPSKSDNQISPRPARVPSTILRSTSLSSAGLARVANRPPLHNKSLSKGANTSGRLTRKEILAEHASRKVAGAKDEK
jgi:regulator of nonsense transcripts 2